MTEQESRPVFEQEWRVHAKQEMALPGPIDSKLLQPLITVIIPTHNHGHLIAESIDSVLDQTYKNVELIVVDDGSNDNTKAVVSTHSDVKYVYQAHRGNRTPARAMNAGLRLSLGEYIVCLAADDKLAPDYLEKCLAEFGDSEVGVVFTGCREFGLSDKLRIPRRLHHRFSVFREPHGQIGAMMVRREVYFERECAKEYYGFYEDVTRFPNAVGIYDESLHSLEDWDFFIRAGLSGWKIRDIPESLHFARVHENRTTYHADISELWRRYPLMRGYGLVSRGFDATAAFVRNPRLMLRRLYGRVVGKLPENPTGFQHGWVDEKNILNKVRGKTLLDCGCGVGRWGYLLRRKHDIVGVDIHRPYLASAKRYESVVLASISHLPFQSKVFDCGLAVEVIEHLGKYDGYSFLGEFKRVAKYGVLTTPKNFEPVNFGTDHPESHRSLWSRNEILGVLAN